MTQTAFAFELKSSHVKALSGRRVFKDLTPQEQVALEMKERPAIFKAYERFALEYASRGQFFGINLIRELVRWHTTNLYKGNNPYKVSNTLSPWYARKLVEKHPELKKYMKIGRLKKGEV